MTLTVLASVWRTVLTECRGYAIVVDYGFWFLFYPLCDRGGGGAGGRWAYGRALRHNGLWRATSCRGMVDTALTGQFFQSESVESLHQYLGEVAG